MNEYIPYLSELLSGALNGISFFVSELILIITFILVILADLFYSKNKSALAFFLSVTGIVASATASFMQLTEIEKEVGLFSNSIVLDKLAIQFKLILTFAVVLFALFIRNNKALQEHKKGTGDMYMLLPAVLLGLNLMSMSVSLLMVYISIEMVSIASYLMVGYVSGANRQTEAAMKYALFGSVCSAIMLYGISLLYAFTGTINIIDDAFIANLGKVSEPAILIAVVLVLVGIGFKLSFVPLHFWSPDVYEGAPTPVTGFLSTAPKIAGFILLIRFVGPLQPYRDGSANQLLDLTSILSGIAILTMIVGNFAAIWQNNIKRMLAYSSIGHTGFAMMAVVAFSDSGFQALIFYFAVYAIMNMAAFMLADRIEQHSGATTAADYRGLGKYFKLEMACFVVILISLTGLPPTGGFVGKLLVFSSAFEFYSLSNSIWGLLLLIAGAVTTVVSLFYYLRIPLNAYLRKAEVERAIEVKPDFLTYVIVVLTFLLTLLGIYPGVLG